MNQQILSLHPHASLRKHAKQVVLPDSLLNDKVLLMNKTLERIGGVGLAANQVFLSDAIFIAKIDGEEIPSVFINPEIAEMSVEKVDSQEGCLSIPRFADIVKRHATVRLKYTDLEGNAQERHFYGQNAVIIQHEMDHLSGHLFIDELSTLKQNIVKKKMLKFKKKNGLV